MWVIETLYVPTAFDFIELRALRIIRWSTEGMSRTDVTCGVSLSQTISSKQECSGGKSSSRSAYASGLKKDGSSACCSMIFHLRICLQSSDGVEQPTMILWTKFERNCLNTAAARRLAWSAANFVDEIRLNTISSNFLSKETQSNDLSWNCFQWFWFSTLSKLIIFSLII